MIAEADRLCFPVHFLDDGYRLQAIAFLTQQATAILLAFFYSDADGRHLSACLIHQVDKRVGSLTVGQKVVDNQHTVGSVQIGP